MTRRSVASALAVAVLAVLAAGCSGDEIRERAEGVASEAAGSASSAAASAVREQICRLVSDADVNLDDVGVLRTLVDGAESAGVDESILGPARRIAEAGDDVPADAVAELEQGCAG